MRYVSLFSGIEAASVAWGPLGWEPVAFSEIEPFCCRVLEERFPEVPNLGDVSKIDWSGYEGSVDVVVGGSPCQSFSIAGKREGLSGESGLMWEYVRAVREIRPEWLLWENVPGALSSSHGNDFRCLLESLDALGYCADGRMMSDYEPASGWNLPPGCFEGDPAAPWNEPDQWVGHTCGECRHCQECAMLDGSKVRICTLDYCEEVDPERPAEECFE